MKNKKDYIVFVFIFLLCAEAVCLFSEVRVFIIRFFENFIIHRKVASFDEKMAYLLHTTFFTMEITGIIALMYIWIKKHYVEISNNFIDFLRVIATACVFILHTAIFTNQHGDVFAVPYTHPLRTPAWGGVWIFFLLSGYLAARGFALKKYEYSLKGITRYYKRKLTNIYIPTLFFIFICCIFVFPTFLKDNPAVIVRLLSCTYNGGPGVNGIGATWFISTLMQLYILCPLFCKMIEMIRERKIVLIIVYAITALLGLSYRMIAYAYSFNWHTAIYAPSYANLDLFICGMLTYYIADVYRKKICISGSVEKISLYLLLLFILINALTYHQLYMYAIVYPTVYVLLVSLNLFVFHERNMPPVSTTGKYITFLSSISFGFYLFHSLILHNLYAFLPVFKNIYLLHAELLICGAVMSGIFAIGFNKIFNRKPCVQVDNTKI